jgi:hypothetical protein
MDHALVLVLAPEGVVVVFRKSGALCMSVGSCPLGSTNPCCHGTCARLPPVLPLLGDTRGTQPTLATTPSGHSLGRSRRQRQRR